MTTKTDPFASAIKAAAAAGYIGNGKPRFPRQPQHTVTAVVAGVTPAQAVFMRKLISDKAAIYAAHGRHTEAESVRGADFDDLIDGMTKQSASGAIDRMILANKELREELAAAARAAVPAVGKPELEDGVYVLDGHVVRVYHTVHGSNQQVAGYWVPAFNEDGTPVTVERKGKVYQDGDWEYQGKAPLRRLTPEHKMPLDAAEAFGKVYGRCCRCGRVLTLKKSIDRGLGSVCAGDWE